MPQRSRRTLDVMSPATDSCERYTIRVNGAERCVVNVGREVDKIVGEKVDSLVAGVEVVTIGW